MELQCQPHLVQTLQERAREMEEDLEKWRNNVKDARNEFYELNYFTTRQLLVLSSELGKLRKDGSGHRLQAQVMALLHSISPDVSSSDVEQAVTSSDVKQAVATKGRRDVLLHTPEIVTEFPLSESSFPSFHLRPRCSPSPSEASVSPVHTQSSEHSPAKQSGRVNLSTDDLDSNQSQTLTELTEKFGYTELQVLRAMEELKTGDQYEILHWLTQHEGELSEMESGGSSEEDSEGEGEGEGEEDQSNAALHDEMLQDDSKPRNPWRVYVQPICALAWTS